MGPRERERRLANQRIDRSHRRRSDSLPRPPSWTRLEKAVLVLSLALIGVAVILAVVLFVL